MWPCRDLDPQLAKGTKLSSAHQMGLVPASRLVISWPTLPAIQLNRVDPGLRVGVSPPTSLKEKQSLSFLSGKHGNHSMCEAASWDENLFFSFLVPLTIYFSQWKRNCSIQFLNTLKEKNTQTKQKPPRLKDINPKPNSETRCFPETIRLDFETKKCNNQWHLRISGFCCAFEGKNKALVLGSMEAWRLLSGQDH